MKLLKRVGLVIGLMVGVLAGADLALAQSLTDSLQAGRMTLLEVNKETGKIYCLDADGKLRVVEFHNGDVPLIVADGARLADLRLLKAGDLIKVERTDERAHTIVVLRRAAEELASPEK